MEGGGGGGIVNVKSSLSSELRKGEEGVMVLSTLRVHFLMSHERGKRWGMVLSMLRVHFLMSHGWGRRGV